MISNDEFSRIVYERYDEYKKKKSERRKRLVKNGTLCAVALIIAGGAAFPLVMPRYTKDADIFAPESNGSIMYSSLADALDTSAPTAGITEDNQIDKVYTNSSKDKPTEEPRSDRPFYTAEWIIDSEHVLYANAFASEGDAISAVSSESADNSGKGSESIEYISVGDEAEKLGFVYVLQAKAELGYTVDEDNSKRRCEIVLEPTESEKTYYLKFYGLYNTEITVKDKEDKQ